MRTPSTLTALALALLTACSDNGLSKVPGDPGSPPDSAGPDTVPPPVPQVALSPAEHDFGALVLGDAATVDLTLANVGAAPLEVRSIRIEGSAELALDVQEGTNGALPWTLAAGESRPLQVRYVPIDTPPDTSVVTAATNDPATPEARALQHGSGRPFAGFSTGWWIHDDPTIQRTDDPAHVVDVVGDPDGYWYEPSGYHAMTGSTDPVRDFAAMAQWVRDRAGAPVPVTGPIDLRTTSTVRRLQGATFAYVLCDFWLAPGDDPGLYEVALDDVDDGVRVLLDGEVLGEVTYGNAGRWGLSGLATGMVHTLLVVLQDNASVDKYVTGLRFTRAGVIVSG
jgi:hypothetical protein